MSEMEARMAQLRERFRARAEADGRRIMAALTAGDHEEVRQIAHSLSGSGGVFGFPEVSAHAEAVELAIDGKRGGSEVALLCNQLLERLTEVAQ